MGSSTPGITRGTRRMRHPRAARLPASTRGRTLRAANLGYGRPWTNLWVNTTNSDPPDAATVLALLRQALLLGYFPGFAGSTGILRPPTSGTGRCSRSTCPLIRKVVPAGWKPINYAKPSDTTIFVERFDTQTGSTFYLTAQNTSTATEDLPDDRGRGRAADRLGIHHRQGARRQHHDLRFPLRLQHPLLRHPDRRRNRPLRNHGSGRLAPPRLRLPLPPAPRPTAASSSAPRDRADGPSGTSSFAGNWTWDVSTASAGTKSAKLVVPGTIDQISPQLRSTNFPITSSKTYTLTVSTKTSSTGGKYSPSVYVVELDASGNILTNSDGSIQHGVSAGKGTTGWSAKSLTFTSDPRAKQAYVYANIYQGHGTVWVDNVQVR